MTGADIPSFGKGSVLELHESDYMYGSGALAIRITEAEFYPGPRSTLEWLFVTGVPLYPRGAEGPARMATIRVAAIREALRPKDWFPDDQTTAKPAYRTALPKRRGGGEER